MTDQEIEQAHKAVWTWRHYFENHGVEGAPAPLPTLMMVVDYAIYLEEVNGLLAIEAGYIDPRLQAALEVHSRPGWWDRFLHIFRSR